jgi:hypothetical protein
MGSVDLAMLDEFGSNKPYNTQKGDMRRLEAMLRCKGGRERSGVEGNLGAETNDGT